MEALENPTKKQRLSQDIIYKELFFRATNNPQLFRCILCPENAKPKKQQDSKGYGNLKAHIQQIHNDVATKMLQKYTEENLHADQMDISNFLVRASPRAHSIYGWLQNVINCHLPFSYVENKYVRAASNLQPITRKTLVKYMTLTTNHVFKMLDEELPNSFGIVFDGWSSYCKHYIGVIATYLNKKGRE